jgi:hypothetical protein
MPKLCGNPRLDDGFGCRAREALATSLPAHHYVGATLLSLAIPFACAVHEHDISIHGPKGP